MSACHALARVGAERRLVGDPLEVKVFEFTRSDLAEEGLERGVEFEVSHTATAGAHGVGQAGALAETPRRVRKHAHIISCPEPGRGHCAFIMNSIYAAPPTGVHLTQAPPTLCPFSGV